MIPLLDIAICTRNRRDYLSACLDHLLPQLTDPAAMVTVIDNGSSDDTKALVETRMRSAPALRYLYAKEPGLSHARNMAWQQSPATWIYYLDDECLPPTGTVDHVLALIRRDPPYAMMGGPIDAAFASPPPDWLPAGWGNFSMPFLELTPIPSGYVRGGNMLIRRSALIDLGGFSPHLGMQGQRQAYGEELDLQRRCRAAGGVIAYDPALRMPHVVRADKLSLRWLLQSVYARARDKALIEHPPRWPAAGRLLRTAIGRLVWMPVFFFRFITLPAYRLKTACFDWLEPLARHAGACLGAWSGRLPDRPE